MSNHLVQNTKTRHCAQLLSHAALLGSCIGAGLASTLSVSPAQAFTAASVNPIVGINTDPADALNPNPPSDILTEGAFTTTNNLGYKFTVGPGSLLVNALGVYDSSSSNAAGTLTDPHVIRLYDSTQAVVASVSIGPTTSCVQSAGFCWAEIPKLLLAPGAYYVAANGGWNTAAGGDAWAEGAGVNEFNSDIVWEESVQGTQNSFPNLPFTNPDPGDPFLDTVPLWGGNVSYTIDVPGPLPILGASVAFGWTRRLRKRVKAAAKNRPQSTFSFD